MIASGKFRDSGLLVGYLFVLRMVRLLTRDEGVLLLMMLMMMVMVMTMMVMMIKVYVVVVVDDDEDVVVFCFLSRLTSRSGRRKDH